MAITEQDEERQAQIRGRRRQDKDVPLLIRDDGMLIPNTKLIRAKPGFRPYHGNPKASLEDRMRYLKGLGAKRAVVYKEEPPEPFDIGTASLEALLEFAQEQYGQVLDPNKPLKQLRQEVFRVSQLPDPSLALPPAENPTHARSTADDMPVLADVIEPPPLEQATKLRGGRQPRGERAGDVRPAGMKQAA